MKRNTFWDYFLKAFAQLETYAISLVALKLSPQIKIKSFYFKKHNYWL